MAQPLLRERRVCADGMPAASLAVGRALSEKWTNGPETLVARETHVDAI